jgi:hypothetical protein
MDKKNYLKEEYKSEYNYFNILFGLFIFYFFSSFLLFYFLTEYRIFFVFASIFSIAVLFIILLFFHKKYDKLIKKINPATMLIIIYAFLGINIFFVNRFYSVEWAFLGFIIAGVISYDSKIDSRFFLIPALIFLAYIPFLLIAQKNTIAENTAIYIYYFLIIGVVLQFIENSRNNKYSLELEDFTGWLLKSNLEIPVIITALISITLIIANRYFSLELWKWSFIYLFVLALVTYIISKVIKKE